MHKTFILKDAQFLPFSLASAITGYIVRNRLSSPQAIKEKEIIQKRGYLLPDLSELQSELIDRIEKRLEEKKLPFTVRRERINNVCYPGSDSQDFLVARLDNYFCYIGCITIGTDLHVNWALCGRYSALRQFILGRYRENDFARTNMVSAFASTILEVTKETAEDISFEQFVKKTRVERETSGVLGPL